MPLKESSSDEAFEENLRAELKAGKEPHQALAIAYSVQRKAAEKEGKKPKKAKKAKEK